MADALGSVAGRSWLRSRAVAAAPAPVPLRPRLTRGAVLTVALVAGPAAAAAPVLAGLPASLLFPAHAAAQEIPLERGANGTALLLRQLDGVQRVLMIGAHPDDEDTALLTALARGQGAETAYLSLTRGDGGQNLIGPELFEGLGVVRTGELIAARALDGGRQYFTRAFDYGFSKSADEALALWPREELLRDVVWVVRSFRPHVIVSIFSGTPADGHGQHQAAGIMAIEAFSAAADPERFPELTALGAEPWQARKLYQRDRGQDGGEVTALETGRFDPVLGRSHFQLAMESRSQHRSQDMGVAQPLGSRASDLVLAAAAPELDEAAAVASFWAGVDTTLAGAAADLPAAPRERVRTAAGAYAEALDAARDGLSATNPAPALAPLGEARSHLETMRAAAGEAGAAGGAFTEVVDTKLATIAEAALAAAGVVVRATVEDDLIVPGDTVDVSVEVWNGGASFVVSDEPELSLPDGWEVVRSAPVAAQAGDGGFFGGDAAAPPGSDGRIEPGALVRWRYRVWLPPDARLSGLYFRERPRDGEMYRWPDDPSVWGLPREAPPIRARARIEIPRAGSTTAVVERDARYLGVDKALGEFTEPVLVVPAVSVAVEPGTMVWPEGLADTRELTVELRGEAAVQGELRLEAPAGWGIEPATVPFAFESGGQSRNVVFRVSPEGAGEGRHVFRAVATLDDGRTYDEGYTLIDYPHIERTAFFEPAVGTVTVTPLAVAEGLRVGYVMGSGDDGPEALRQMGVQVEMLGPERVRAGDFAGLDALVLGIRTYETRPDAVGANAQILDFARRGGTVVVQYNKQEYPEGGFAPHPVEMGRRPPRVTDEASPVELVDPASPLLLTPNRITGADFDGWVQERGLYFLSDWDEGFRPQLALTDPGEEPALGSLLVAPVGEGVYIYTGLSFFRQFPAGVAGAYRLFANMVSLDPAAWRSHVGVGGG